MFTRHRWPCCNKVVGFFGEATACYGGLFDSLRVLTVVCERGLGKRNLHGTVTKARHKKYRVQFRNDG